MSRVGLKPISLPEKVDVKVEGNTVKVEGPKGKLDFSVPAGISLTSEDGSVVVTRATEQREHRALHGTVRSIVNNMIIGVSTGFAKDLEIHGVGLRAAVKGKDLGSFPRPFAPAPPPDPIRPHGHGERKHQDQG